MVDSPNDLHMVLASELSVTKATTEMAYFLMVNTLTAVGK